MDRKKFFCRCCGDCSEHKILLARDMFLGTRDPFPYIYCQKCFSLSIATIPQNISDYYSNYYSFCDIQHRFKFSSLLKRYALKNKNYFSKKILSFFKKESDLRIKALASIPLDNTNIKILDVGSGSGDLVCELFSLGYKNIEGIDPFLNKDIVYNDSLKITKKHLSEVNDKYDLIMFHHTFEHMPDPNATAVSIKNNLNKDGICVVRIPNVSSYAFRLFRESWFGIHAPFHYVLPSVSVFHNIIKNNGLKVVDMVGENLVEFFIYSSCHYLNICDYDELGGRKELRTGLFNPSHPLFESKEFSFWKKKAKNILKHPEFCDWITYYLKLDG